MTTNHSPYSPHSLESLVPPLDLCRKIPPGAFENSALAWAESCAAPFVHDRATIEGAIGGKIIAPAPTAIEILQALDDNGFEFASLCIMPSGNWYAHCFSKPLKCQMHQIRVEDKNPVIAAMKLWLNINGITRIPRIPSPIPEVKP